MPNDELQQLWQTQPDLHKEDPQMTLALIQQRDRLFHDLWRARLESKLIFTGILWPLTGLCSFYTHYPLMRAGYGLMALALGVCFLVLLAEHKSRNTPDPARTPMSEYAQLLAKSFEHRIRFMRGLQYWFVLPMYAGAAIIVWQGLAARISPMAASLLTAVLFLGLFWASKSNVARRISELEAQKSDALRLAA